MDGDLAWLSGGVCLDLSRGTRVARPPSAPALVAASVEVRGRTIQYSKAGATWTVRPFTKTPIDRIIDADLDATGSVVVVRAESWDEGGLVRIVARLDAKTGKLRELERDADPIAAECRRYVGSVRPWKDGALLIAVDQIIVVRSEGKSVRVQRLATPRGLGSVHVDGDRVLAIVTINNATELACFPLPALSDPDELGLILAPRGPANVQPIGEEAEVTFAGSSAPFVVFAHPRFGRITLPRAPGQPIPKVGDRAILEGIKPSPGVVSARRWSIVGATTPRGIRACPLYDAPLRPEPEPRTGPLLAPARARAKAAGIKLPEDVVAILRQVEREPAFREALAQIEIDFDGVDEEALGPILEETPDFVALYGTGDGESFGGLAGGKVVVLAEGYRDRPAPDLTTAILKAAKSDPERKATRAYIERTLPAR